MNKKTLVTLTLNLLFSPFSISARYLWVRHY